MALRAKAERDLVMRKPVYDPGARHVSGPLAASLLVTCWAGELVIASMYEPTP